MGDHPRSSERGARGAEVRTGAGSLQIKCEEEDVIKRKKGIHWWLSREHELGGAGEIRSPLFTLRAGLKLERSSGPGALEVIWQRTQS